MTDKLEIVNLALQSFGGRTTITQVQLDAGSNNEAKQANLAYEKVRDDLLRMAPWECAFNAANLTLITALPGTPENTSAATALWQKGQPVPPWVYEYQYPANCLRACWIIPQFQGFGSEVPIFPVTTGGAVQGYRGPPVRFKIGIDQFYPVTSAVVVAGGSGYVVGELITAALGPITATPIGAPVVLQVLTIGGGGAILTAAVVNQIMGSATPLGGSYFSPQANPVAQGSTTGVGTGATFNLTYGSQGDQRVILTNQEFAVLAYCKQVIDPNVFDSLFQSALSDALGARLCLALTGDKQLANFCVQRANESIKQARAVDGNEGLTINDVTPDWIRARGYQGPDWTGASTQFDWGSMWPSYS